MQHLDSWWRWKDTKTESDRAMSTAVVDPTDQSRGGGSRSRAGG